MFTLFKLHYFCHEMFMKKKVLTFFMSVCFWRKNKFKMIIIISKRKKNIYVKELNYLMI